MVNKMFLREERELLPFSRVALNVDLIVTQAGFPLCEEMFCFPLGESTPSKKCRADSADPDQCETSFLRCVASSQSMGPILTWLNLA